jgi:hypothetical protein
MPTKVTRGLAVVGVLAFAPSAGAQTRNYQTDPRDYEALAVFLPNDSLAPLGYFRQASTADTLSASASEAFFAGAFVHRFGPIGVAWFTLASVADAAIYAPTTTPGQTTTLHASGIGDTLFGPSLTYAVAQDEFTHTYFALTGYALAPTGVYDVAKPFNIGENRWRFQPQIAAGQRFLKAMTAEIVADVGFHTANSDFGLGPGLPVGRLTESPTYGLEVHLTGDLSPDFYLAVSYYLETIGRRTVWIDDVPAPGAGTPARVFQTLRFTWGIRFEKSTLLLLQFEQDVAASDGGSISRFVGARLSHLIPL